MLDRWIGLDKIALDKATRDYTGSIAGRVDDSRPNMWRMWYLFFYLDVDMQYLEYGDRSETIHIDRIDTMGQDKVRFRFRPDISGHIDS